MPTPRTGTFPTYRRDAMCKRAPALPALLLGTLTLGGCAMDSATRTPVPAGSRTVDPAWYRPDARNVVEREAPGARGTVEPPVAAPAAPQDDGFRADPGEPLTRARALIATDLGSGLAQAIAIHTRIVQAERDDERPFARAYLAELIGRGVGVRYVAGDQGAWLLSHARTAPSDTGEFAYRLSAGPVAVSRTYRISDDGQGVTALSALTVTGSRAPVDLDTDAMQAAALANRIAYTDPPELDGPAPLISLLEAPDGVPVTPGGPSSIGTARNVEVENLFYSLDPFAGIESTHDRVERHVVVFANDSLMLGADNRSLLYRFVERSVEDGDRVLLIGCSNGPTEVAGGNESLALGRATRVTDALVAVGIDRRTIDQEGCWAGSADPKGLPGRGVVLDVWRPRGARGAS